MFTWIRDSERGLVVALVLLITCALLAIGCQADYKIYDFGGESIPGEIQDDFGGR